MTIVAYVLGCYRCPVAQYRS